MPLSPSPRRFYEENGLLGGGLDGFAIQGQGMIRMPTLFPVMLVSFWRLSVQLRPLSSWVSRFDEILRGRRRQGRGAGGIQNGRGSEGGIWRDEKKRVLRSAHATIAGKPIIASAKLCFIGTRIHCQAWWDWL